MLYKYALLEGTKIIKVWGSYNNFHLAYPILIIPLLSREDVLENYKTKFSNPEGPKFWIYSRRNIV
jgi:hypothetical protein